MPKRHIANSVGDDLPSTLTRLALYDAAGDGVVSVAGENPVAALQDLIYARFAGSADEEISPLPEESQQFENTVSLASRVAGVALLIAALIALAITFLM